LRWSEHSPFHTEKNLSDLVIFDDEIARIVYVIIKGVDTRGDRVRLDGWLLSASSSPPVISKP
jgi:hypothetical protein